MQDWQQRVVTEKEELDDKIIRLYIFIQASSATINAPDLIILEEQWEVMLRYSNILNRRMLTFKKENDD